MPSKTTESVKEGLGKRPPTEAESQRSTPIGGLTPVVVPPDLLSDLKRNPAAAGQAAAKPAAQGAAKAAPKAGRKG